MSYRQPLTLEETRSVAIVRPQGGLGDLLCVVPALRALRTALPQAQITLIGLSSAREFVSRFRRYLDGLLEFPGYPGIKEVPVDPARIVKFLGQVQQVRLDAVIQLYDGGINMNPFVMLLGASRVAGFYTPGHYCPAPEHFIPYPSEENEIKRHLLVMEHLGIPPQGEHLEFPISEDDWPAMEALATRHGLRPGNYVCVHPGASVVERRWRATHFAHVADALASTGMKVVLTGIKEEADLLASVASAMKHEAIDSAGLALGPTAALLTGARLLVCNDTGISHLAAALKVKSLVIFSASDPRRWAPLDRDLHHAVSTGKPGDTVAAELVAARAMEILKLACQSIGGVNDRPRVKKAPLA